ERGARRPRRRPPSPGAEGRVDRRAQPVVRDANRATQGSEPRGRRVQELADGVEAASEGGAEGGQRGDATGDVAEQRPPLLGERRLEARRGIEGLGDLEELLGV